MLGFRAASCVVHVIVHQKVRVSNSSTASFEEASKEGFCLLIMLDLPDSSPSRRYKLIQGFIYGSTLLFVCLSVVLFRF